MLPPRRDNSLAQVSGVTLSAKGMRTPRYETEETTP
jgi:hypothetical protein